MSSVISISTELWGNGKLTVADPATGYYFSDVEKVLGSALDTPSCWLFAAANTLFWGGWATALDGFVTADDFYDYAISCWGARVGGDEREAFYWWLDGGVSTGFPEYFPDGGNRFPDLAATEYGGRITVSNAESHFALMRQFIDGGYGVTLGIYAAGLSHAISCWGYEFDGENYYLYYSDSDDTKAAADRRDAADTLLRSQISIVNGTLYLSDYRHAGNSPQSPQVRIGDFSCFIQYDPIYLGAAEEFASASVISCNEERRGRVNAVGDDDIFLLNLNAATLALALTFMLDGDSEAELHIYAPDHTLLYADTGDTLKITLPSAGLEYVYLRVVGTVLIESDDPLANVYRLISCADGRWSASGGMLRPINGSTATLYVADAVSGDIFAGAIISGAHFKVCAGSAVGTVAAAELHIENALIESHISAVGVENNPLISIAASEHSTLRGNIDCPGGTLSLSGAGENLAFNGTVTAELLAFCDFIGEFNGKVVDAALVISGESKVFLTAAANFSNIAIHLDSASAAPRLTAPQLELVGTAVELFISPELLTDGGFFALFSYFGAAESTLEIKLESGDSIAIFDLAAPVGFTACGYDFAFAVADDMLFLDYARLPETTLA